jgi:hypothetical protein
MKTRDFEELAARLARRRRGGDEWQLVTPFSVLPARRAAREVIFSTKESGLMGLRVTDLLRTSTTWVWHYGVTSRPEWLRLRAERDLGASVLYFLGDLDPLDLSVFASLVAGIPTHGMKVVHLGVGDEWLRLAEEHLKVDRAQLPTIKMSPFEIATYRALRDLRGALPVGVSVEGQAILSAGQKLEIEGVSNPAFYEGGFSIALEKMLRRRLAATRR